MDAEFWLGAICGGTLGGMLGLVCVPVGRWSRVLSHGRGVFDWRISALAWLWLRRMDSLGGDRKGGRWPGGQVGGQAVGKIMTMAEMIKTSRRDAFRDQVLSECQ